MLPQISLFGKVGLVVQPWRVEKMNRYLALIFIGPELKL
jgi:hypothetical protein